MDVLKNWKVKRSNGAMTVTHSCGRVTGIDTVTAEDGKVIASSADGRRYELAVQS